MREWRRGGCLFVLIALIQTSNTNQGEPYLEHSGWLTFSQQSLRSGGCSHLLLCRLFLWFFVCLSIYMSACSPFSKFYYSSCYSTVHIEMFLLYYFRFLFFIRIVCWVWCVSDLISNIRILVDRCICPSILWNLHINTILGIVVPEHHLRHLRSRCESLGIVHPDMPADPLAWVSDMKKMRRDGKNRSQRHIEPIRSALYSRW